MQPFSEWQYEHKWVLLCPERCAKNAIDNLCGTKFQDCNVQYFLLILNKKILYLRITLRGEQMYFWRCPKCFQGQMDTESPDKCLTCGYVGGGWKKFHYKNSKTWICGNCGYGQIEGGYRPSQPCEMCRKVAWKEWE